MFVIIRDVDKIFNRQDCVVDRRVSWAGGPLDRARGFRGHAPPEKFLNLHSRKCVSRDFLGKLRPFWAVFSEQE